MRRRLTDFDTYPEAMLLYMRHNGPHFNKKLCDFAVSKMTKWDKSRGEEVPIVPYKKETIENLLKAHGVILKKGIQNACVMSIQHEMKLQPRIYKL